MSTDHRNEVSSPCFVSHSYRDSASVDRLRQLLRGSVELEIFARVEPDPANAVSDGLIPKIRKCKSLIYLKGSASASSFWVSFERDYAHRSGLDVFAFDPANALLSIDDSAPINLSVNTLYHPEDATRVDSLFDWMRMERNFDLRSNRAAGRLGGTRSEDKETLRNILIHGGGVLWLAGRHSVPLIDGFRLPGFGQHDTGFTSRIAEARLGRSTDGLDDVEPLNEYNQEFYYVTDPYQFVSEVHVRIDPGLHPAWQPMGGDIIDLLSGADGENEFNWNRVDDLIIRLYAALSMQHRRRIASPPNTRALLEDHLPALVDFWEADPEAFGRTRLGTGKRPYASWTLTANQAVQILDRVALHLGRRYGRPTRVSRLETPTYPFEDEFPARFVVAWDRGRALIELSLEFDGPLAKVFVRRVRQPDAG